MALIELINPTTYEVELLGKDKVEIGDRDNADFKPHIKLNRWDGECFIAIQPAGEIEEEVEYEVEGDKIKCKCKVKQDDLEFEWETEFYPLEPRTIIAKDKEGRDIPLTQNELGGFEFEVILKKKPKTNKVTLNIEAQGLKFLYQPLEIPPQCIDDEIAENVRGSYAVYHETKDNPFKTKADGEKYKTGKAFHIYRPKIIDAVGNWVWGILNIDEQTLTVTIDQNFLDTAVYPIRHATGLEFGYTTLPTYGNTTNTDKIQGSVYTVGATGGTGDNIRAALNCVGAGNPYKMAVYDASANLVANSPTNEGTDVTGTTAFMPQNHASGSPTYVALTSYVIVCWSDNPNGWNRLHFDWDTGVTHKEEALAYGSFPASISGGWDTSDVGKKYGIYCTFTEEGGVTHYGAATLSGVGTLAGIGRGIFVGKATLSGTGVLAAIGRRLVTGLATLSGVGTLAAIGGVFKLGAATLAGVGTLVAKGVLTATGKATLSGTGTLAVIGRRIVTGVGTLAGTGTLAGKGVITAIGKSTLSGVGSLAAIGTVIEGGVIKYGSAVLSGVGTLTASGVRILTGKATLAGIGSLSAIGRVIGEWTATLRAAQQAKSVYPVLSITLTHDEDEYVYRT